jgi:uncharacterized Fe-S cluster protein YjdI
MQERPEARQRRGVSRRYSNAALVVKWEPEYCIHAAQCWRNLPNVFKPAQSPWVDPDAATADDLARVIMMCPSGALSFERLDGGAQEQAPGVTVVDPTPDGPLYLRGRIRIEDGTGNLIREATRVALCRCGFSANKPFCDDSHRRAGFKTG